MDNLVFKRISVETFPGGGFIYVLHFVDSNFIQIGLGHESKNGLQLSHILSQNTHHLHAYETANWFESAPHPRLILGKLAEIFTGDVERTYLDLTKDQAKSLATSIRKLHDDVWGNPHAWEPNIISLCDGRVVWCCYDDDSDRIRLGIGMVTESNETCLGDNSFMLSKQGIAEFVTDIYRGRAIHFFVTPPRWPHAYPKWVSELHDLRSIAAEMIRLADKVWPGQIDADEDKCQGN